MQSVLENLRQSEYHSYGGLITVDGGVVVPNFDEQNVGAMNLENLKL